ncbi:MAG: hybrid sensor histidine kinase/response regulator [Candidatus Methylomirabilia bacterium]
MRRGSRSVTTLILVPIAAVLATVAIGLAMVVHRATTHVADDYQAFAVDTYGQRVQTLLDTAVAELRTADLLENRQVAAAKQQQVLEALSLLWSGRELDGIVTDEHGAVLFTSLPGGPAARLARHRSPGYFRDGVGSAARFGTVTQFIPWRWTVITLLKPATHVFSRREVRLLVPLVALGCALMAAGVLVILHWNFHRPVTKLLADLAAERPVRETGVAEFDTIGRAINTVLGRLLKKTEQYQLLHNLAVSVHEMLSVDDLLHVILGRAKELLAAELAAIVLYDAQGRFGKVHALPEGILGPVGKLPLGKGILGAVRDATTPLCIDDLRAHPAFSGAFPPGHPEIRNLLGCPIFTPEGHPVGALYFGNKPGGFTQDDRTIIEAIAADAAIALAKAKSLAELRRFREVVESSFNAILIADAAGTVRYANPAFERMTGHGRDAVLGEPLSFLGIGALDGTTLEQIRAQALAGEVWTGVISPKRADGTPYSAAVAVLSIHTDEGASLVSIQRDQTQEKYLSDQLLRAQKLEAIGTLASGIAHDFNNILAGILGYAEVLLLQTREGEPFHKAATIIGQAAERGAELAQKILMVARKERMAPQSIALNDLVRDTAALLRGSLPGNVELVIKLGAGLPLINADPTQLHQIVMNLATNARDAMSDGGRLTIETAVAAPRELQLDETRAVRGGYLRLSVSDTGVGMDEETKRRVYDPFFTTKGAGRGTGLGLYIVHTVVTNHEGYLNLYSEPGQGTRVAVYLPVTPAAAGGAEQPPADLRGSGTVLVIDDEYAVREICKDLLGPLGYTVITASDGDEGLRRFREARETIGVVVLDMVMPKLGGGEVFEALRRIRPDVPVILCSGYSQNGYAGIQALIAEGAVGFVQKPFTLNAIGTAIKQALAPRPPALP